MKTFESLVRIQSRMLSYFAQSGEYASWSDEFCGQEEREIIKKWFEGLERNEIPWETFTIVQLKMLGFSWWDESETLLLIPLHFRRAFYTKDIEDNDQRSGCLAYGFPVKDGVVDFSNKGEIK